MKTSKLAQPHAFIADGGWQESFRFRDARAHAGRILAASASRLREAGSAVVDVRSTLRRWCEERRTIEILRRLSDRELRDIGFERSEIPFIVHGLARDATPADPSRAGQNETSSQAVS